MTEQWYYSRNGQRFGPVPAEQLRQLAAARQLLPTDMLWKNGLSGWVAASTIPGLFAADTLDTETTARKPPPPPPPPAPARRAADPLDVQATARSIADSPPRRAPAGDALDVQATARPIAEGPPRRNLGGDDLDREVTARTANGPPPVQARPASPAADFKGQVIDNFLITRRLGEGGMGVVYKATDRDTDVEYAIKVLPTALSADPRALADLKKEVANAQALTHQNLLKINYLATSGSLSYIVMEYIDGDTLEEYRLRKGRTIPAEDFKKIAPQILSGLEYLHEKGVVHRDVKPQNIMISHNGDIKITDYGIALSIKEQLQRGSEVEAMGTLAYSAPEQMAGGDLVDRRADVYAVGMMFHRLVSGQFPFNEKDRNAIVAWHKDPNHRIANLGNPALNVIIQKALSVNPAARFASCRELLKELAQYGLIESQDAEPAAPAASGRTEQLLELTRLIRQQLQRRLWDLKNDFNYPQVMKNEDGNYELPKGDAFSRMRAFAKRVTGGLVHPAEELANEIDALQTHGQQIDPRINQNVMVLVEEAERRLTKEAIPIGGWISLGAAGLGVLLIIIGAVAQSGPAALIGFLLIVYGGFVGGMFTLRPLWAKRRFCNDVLHFLRKAPEGPRFN